MAARTPTSTLVRLETQDVPGANGVENIMSTLVSLVRHPVTLRGADGIDVVIPPSGEVALVSAVKKAGAETHPGVPVPVDSPDVWGEVTGLPAPRDGVLFVVSFPVAQAMAGKGRSDLVALGTGPADGAIRDEKNFVVAVTRLKRVAA